VGPLASRPAAQGAAPPAEGASAAAAQAGNSGAGLPRAGLGACGNVGVAVFLCGQAWSAEGADTAAAAPSGGCCTAPGRAFAWQGLTQQGSATGNAGPIHGDAAVSGGVNDAAIAAPSGAPLIPS